MKNLIKQFKEFKTLKEWEDFGLLEQLPEDRKEMVVSCYNIAIKWLTNTRINSNDRIIELILPLFYRIAKVVDLTEIETLETCKEFRQSWITRDSKEEKSHYYGIDFETMFVARFAEMKINQIKNK
jgi:hypothetical protein